MRLFLLAIKALKLQKNLTILAMLSCYYNYCLGVIATETHPFPSRTRR